MDIVRKSEDLNDCQIGWFPVCILQGDAERAQLRGDPKARLGRLVCLESLVTLSERGLSHHMCL